MNSRQHIAALFLVGAAFITTDAGTPTDAGASVREGPQSVSPTELNVGRLVADLEFAPVKGPKFSLSNCKSAQAVVIAFTSTSCPVTKRYAPTLAALEKEYSALGVKFIFVNPIETDTPSEVAGHPHASVCWAIRVRYKEPN